MSYDQASFIFGNGDILWIFFFFFSIEYGLKNSIDFRFMTSATFVEV